MKAFLIRARNIFIRPKNEWHAIKDEPTTYKQVVSGYVAVLAAVPLAISAIETITLGSGVKQSDRFASIGFLFMAHALWYVMIVVDIIILGAIINAFVTTGGSQQDGRAGLKVAAYSATPLFLVGIVVFIPGMGWLVYCAVLYSVYLLYLGITSLLDMEHSKAAWYAVASFMAAGVIVGVLNLFEYLFESYLARTFILPG
jgi:Yip1 domain